jgi:hypothetical protein
MKFIKLQENLVKSMLADREEVPKDRQTDALA